MRVGGRAASGGASLACGWKSWRVPQAPALDIPRCPRCPHLAAEWADDLSQLCAAMPFMPGCTLAAQCEVRAVAGRAGAAHVPLPPANPS